AFGSWWASEKERRDEGRACDRRLLYAQSASSRNEVRFRASAHSPLGGCLPVLSSLPLSSIIENFLGPNGRFSELLEGYEHRESQIAMAEAVHDVLVRGGKLVVEAGTGTGKTMA